MPARIHGVALIAMLVSVAVCHEGRGSRPPTMRRLQLEQLAAYELSGSTHDERGRLWAVAENARLLFRLDDPLDERAIPETFAITGIPSAIELESLTFLEPGLFAVGGESDGQLAAGPIFLLRLVEDRAEAVARWTLPWSLWQLEPHRNEGVEALCTAGPHVIAGVETALEQGGRRWALLARTERNPGSIHHAGWTAYRVSLSSRSGKLSALDCALDEDEIEALAIERHYDVARLLRFEIPAAGPGTDLTPEPAVDLTDAIGDLPNMEGVTTSAHAIHIITDRGTHQATENLILTPASDDD